MAAAKELIDQLLLARGEVDKALAMLGRPAEGAVTPPPATLTPEQIYWADWKAMVASEGIEHYTAEELLYLGDSHHTEGSPAFGLNSLPPRSMWDRLIAVASVWDELRRRLEQPIRLSSTYRNKVYNAKVGGVLNSYHLHGMAMDGMSYGAPPERLAEIAREMRDEGVFKGGIGTYPTFIHLDVRDGAADW